MSHQFQVFEPASQYLVGAVELAAERGCSHALVAVNELDASVLYIAPGQWGSHRPEILSHAAPGNLVALCGSLRDDIETVAALRDRGEGSSVIAAVGAGVHEFGRALGSRVGGVIGPSQWESEDTFADVSPNASRMVAAYRALHGSSLDYLAVQAWSCGALAEAGVDQVGLEPEDLWSWARRFVGRTAYGDFRLDSEGRQVGHRVALLVWTTILTEDELIRLTVVGVSRLRT